jgi:hypothetical protein
MKRMSVGSDWGWLVVFAGLSFVPGFMFPGALIWILAATTLTAYLVKNGRPRPHLAASGASRGNTPHAL